MLTLTTICACALSGCICYKLGVSRGRAGEPTCTLRTLRHLRRLQLP